MSEENLEREEGTTPETGAEEVAEAATEAPGTPEEETSPLEEAMSTISALEDQLKRAQASLYNTEQEYSNYVRRSKQEAGVHRDNGVTKVIEALLPVLDDVELARQHGDLEGPTGLIAEKIEQILETNFKVVRFGKEGEPFDPEKHDALMHSTSPEVEEEVIQTLIQPGYFMGDKLLRAARVGVVSPE